MSTPQDPLRVGLLGYGLAGRVFHAPLISATRGITLAAVVTRDPSRRARLREEHPDAVGLDTPEQLWDRASALDLVVVATPNNSHVSLARAALRAGLPVVVDKPFAPSAAEARSLLTEAKARGLLLTVFQNRRWDGDFLTVRRLIEEGALGKVQRFESRFERWSPSLDENWRESGEPKDAGGVLFDLGAHLIDQALQLFGRPKAVYAEVDRRRPGATVDDEAFVALEHPSGVRSHLWMSKVAAQHGPRFRVLGAQAAFTKYGLDGQEPALLDGAVPGSAGYGEEPPERWGSLGQEGTLKSTPTLKGCYQRFYEGVVDALQNGAQAPVDPGEAISALEVIEAARTSASRGQVERLFVPAHS